MLRPVCSGQAIIFLAMAPWHTGRPNFLETYRWWNSLKDPLSFRLWSFLKISRLSIHLTPSRKHEYPSRRTRPNNPSPKALNHLSRPPPLHLNFRKRSVAILWNKIRNCVNSIQTIHTKPNIPSCLWCHNLWVPYPSIWKPHNYLPIAVLSAHSNNFLSA
jgi:hypothetical protein